MKLWETELQLWNYAGGPQSERAVKPVDQSECHQSQFTKHPEDP